MRVVVYVLINYDHFFITLFDNYNMVSYGFIVTKHPNHIRPMRIRRLTMLRRMIKNKKGQGLVEYALIIAVVAVLIVGALTTFRGAIEGVFTAIGTALGAAG